MSQASSWWVVLTHHGRSKLTPVSISSASRIATAAGSNSDRNRRKSTSNSGDTGIVGLAQCIEIRHNLRGEWTPLGPRRYLATDNLLMAGSSGSLVGEHANVRATTILSTRDTVKLDGSHVPKRSVESQLLDCTPGLKFHVEADDPIRGRSQVRVWTHRRGVLITTADRQGAWAAYLPTLNP